MSSLSGASPRVIARVAGVFYLLTFVTGFYALLARNTIAGLIAGACYLAVTILLFALFRPVSRGASAVAALFSLAGILVGPLQLGPVHPFVFFGCYCVLLGYLILRSALMPCAVGLMMLLAGAGWLTFAAPGFAQSLYPYNLAPGIIGEGVLTFWLLVFGVKEPAAPAARVHA